MSGTPNNGQDIEFAKLITDLEKVADGEARWDEPVIDGPFGKMTKRDVFDYYSHSKIRRKLMDQLQGKEAIVVQQFTPDRGVLKRKEDGKIIQITQDEKNTENPKDLSYFTERRAVEFHPVYGKKTDVVSVDIDPGAKVPFDRTKAITKMVQDFMRKEPGIGKVDVAFSGGRGFHVRAELDKPMGIDEAKKHTEDILARMPKGPDLTLGINKDPTMTRLDTSTLHYKGSLRALFSLHGDTGLASVPVKNVESFQKEQAKPEAFLGKIPHATPQRP